MATGDLRYKFPFHQVAIQCLVGRLAKVQLHGRLKLHGRLLRPRVLDVHRFPALCRMPLLQAPTRASARSLERGCEGCGEGLASAATVERFESLYSSLKVRS